jgi:hypothetical protein
METCRLCKKYYGTEEEATAQQRSAEALINELRNEETHKARGNGEIVVES